MHIAFLTSMPGAKPYNEYYTTINNLLTVAKITLLLIYY